MLLDDKTISCENGQALSIEGDFCHQCQECPIVTYSTVAFTSNCSKRSNHFCPVYHQTLKICMEKDVSIADYCSDSYGEYWNCPKANKGLDFEQCNYM